MIQPPKLDTLLDRINLRTRSVDRLALVIVLLLHLGAACRFLPPAQVLRPEPLHVGDHPVHTHRVYMYRQSLFESGLPWGYDPEISAGAVMNPGQDLGAKPQEVLGLLLPFLSPGAVVRLFLFLAVLSFPLWTLLACRRLGIPSDHQVWILFTLVASTWLLQEGAGYWHVGLVGFAAAAFFSVYVLALFLSFLTRPAVRVYVAFCLAASALLLLHILGPLIIIPPLLLYTLGARSLSWSWRVALLLVPLIVLALNAFWVFPFMMAQDVPRPVGPLPQYPPGSALHLRFGEWSALVPYIAKLRRSGPLLLRLILAVYGFFVLKKIIGRRAAVSLGLVCAFGFFLIYVGSFIPLTARMHPIRFEVPLLVFLAIPAGTGLAALAGRFRLPVSATAAALALVLTLGVTVFRPRPNPLTLPPSPDPLAEFVSTRTQPRDRLMIQSPDGYRGGGYETKIFPMILDREVIGSNFQVVYDPPQFLRTMLLGREIEDWMPEALREALPRWGVAWVFTVTEEARALLAATWGHPGEPVGPYYAFPAPESPTRFMIGTGQVKTKVNRITLSGLRPDEGLVVLRYRYNPGWHATPDVPVYQFAVPEDRMGFIALKDPPESVTLHFDPWRMLRAPWPDQGISASPVNTR